MPHLFWLPRRLPCPYVMTVHDVLDHMYRTRGKSSLRRSVHFQLTRRALMGASRILAVSQFTKTEIEKLFQIPSEKIQVVYNAIDERFLRGHASENDRGILAERYQITYPFVLYAGSVAPHKNVSRIIEAFSALKTELEKEDKFKDLKLIIIGDDLSGHPDLRRTVIRSGVQNDVRFLGFVPIEVSSRFLRCCKGVRISIALRRIRTSASGSDGARNACNYFEYVVAAGSHGERGRDCESGKRF